MPEDCIFCKIIGGEVPSDTLHRDDTVIAIRDINPRAPTHMLVIPMEHITYLDTVSADKEALLGHLLLVGRDMARSEGLIESGYRLAINQGQDAGQMAPHLHLHVLGGRPLGAEG